MGDTLEGQKKKAPKRNMSSSRRLGRGFDQRLPSAVAARQARRGIMGSASPRAAIMDATSALINLFRDEEGQRGARMADKAAEKLVEKNRPDKNLKELLNRNDCVMAEKTRVF